MTKTADNLEAAFAGESQASTRYLAFARRAEREGYHQVARLFRAAAMVETVHARNHLETMERVKSTRDNLRAAIAGENMEDASHWTLHVLPGPQMLKTKVLPPYSSLIFE